jgi:predicted amidohydrolase YtcJ
MIACVLVMTSLVAATTLDSSSPRADLVLINGRIWTVDRTRPEVQALAIWHSRILALGSDQDIRNLIGPATKVIDLGKRLALPGFYDSHIHLLGAGQRLQQVALKDARDEADFAARLKEFDKRLPRDRWLLGGDWDHDRTFAGTLPTAELLDRYVPDRPAFLRRYDGHMALANSRVLRMAGITAATADPSGGVIYRKANSREPTGILRDNAMSLVASLIPPMSDREVSESIRAALQHIAQNGVTSVQDMAGSDAPTQTNLFQHYQDLARAGELTCRVDLRWPLSDWQQLAKLGVRSGFGDDWVRIAGVKGFMDGSLGSSTAKMFDPYLNEPNTTGIFVTPPGVMRDMVIGADKAGISVAVHAIGDRANAELLDIFGEAERANGPRDRRFRIEHAQHLRPQDYSRFHELGVIASMQPYHVIDDGRWAEARIGAKRCAASYAYGSLRDQGALLAFGSDWSVAPISPILGIDAAVNRRPLDGKHPDGWYREQAITVAEAIEAYTLGSAYAGFEEKDRGTLAVGKLADLVVLSRDILSPAERDHIAAADVVLTMVGGKVVYSK